MILCPQDNGHGLMENRASEIQTNYTYTNFGVSLSEKTIILLYECAQCGRRIVLNLPVTDSY